VFAIAASGAPHAEDYFVEFASQVEGADAPDVLHAKFQEIKSSSRGDIIVRTLVKIAGDAGSEPAIAGRQRLDG